MKPPVLLNVLDSPLTPSSLSSNYSNTIFWTDFEQQSQLWSSRGGSWTLVATGYKGKGIYGVDNGGGIGSASQYYLSSLPLSNTTFYVSVKLRNITSNGYAGLAFINSGLNRLYEVSIHRASNLGYLQIWSYGVESSNGWVSLASSNSFTYTTQWYTIIVYYEYRSSSVYFSVQLYAEDGSLITSLDASSTSNRRFPVQYVGLELDNSECTFDDFIISLKNPATMTITGLQPGIILEVYDNEGRLVGSGVSATDSAIIPVITDVVVGTGTGAVLKLQTSYGIFFINTSNPLVGGETYYLTLSRAFDGSTDQTRTSSFINIYVVGSTLNITIISVENLDVNEYEVRLYLTRFETNGSCSLKVIIASNSSSSKPIHIENNNIISSSTSSMRIQNDRLNIVLQASIPNPDYTATLSLEYCSPERSTCVSYPITISSTRGGLS